MVINQGEVWWARLGTHASGEPASVRPVVVIQSDSFNRSAIQTVVVAELTSDLTRADAPGNVSLSAKSTGLPKDAVVNVSKIVTIEKRDLSRKAGQLPSVMMQRVLTGITLVLGTR